MDTWTSSAQQSFFAVTVHYAYSLHMASPTIMKSVLLAFKPLEKPHHDTEYMRSVIAEILEQFHIQDDIAAITSYSPAFEETQERALYLGDPQRASFNYWIGEVNAIDEAFAELEPALAFLHVNSWMFDLQVTLTHACETGFRNQLR
jgi:hypothetical protein